MLPHPGIYALNHLLKAEAWAREKLRPFAGQCVEFRAPLLPSVSLEILDSGLLADAAEDAVPNLIVNIGAGALPALFRGEDALLHEIGITGSADLTEAVQFLFRNLRWDFEEDLARVLGDVLAHRVVAGGQRFAEWNRDAAEKLAQNFAEYWMEEQPLLATPAGLRRFVVGVDQLREELAELERRIEALARTA